jgi:hypothetical protein
MISHTIKYQDDQVIICLGGQVTISLPRTFAFKFNLDGTVETALPTVDMDPIPLNTRETLVTPVKANKADRAVEMPATPQKMPTLRRFECDNSESEDSISTFSDAESEFEYELFETDSEKDEEYLPKPLPKTKPRRDPPAPPPAPVLRPITSPCDPPPLNHVLSEQSGQKSQDKDQPLIHIGNGYSIGKSDSVRADALTKAIKQHGCDKVLLKLHNLVSWHNKNPQYAENLAKDIRHVETHFEEEVEEMEEVHDSE